MSKMPIKWHKECLKNTKAYMEQQKLELDRMQRNFARIASDVAFLECQIQEAENQGKDGFDAERFLGGRTRK